MCPLSVLSYVGISLRNGKNLAGLSLAELLLQLRQVHFACNGVLEITWK